MSDVVQYIFISLNTLNKKVWFRMCSTVSVFDQRRQGKYTAIIRCCRVCGDKARYIHYGALVCSSCKTFFRRYASYTTVGTLFDQFH